MKRKSIKVDYLARVEGEGGLFVRLKGDRVEEVRLNIFEPPRFFEAFLQGRGYNEVPDITARICGICPVAYQMSAVHAIESTFGVRVEGQLRALRRLLYCSEWIESHCLHIFMLHAPDFLGYEDAIRMAKDHREIVELGLRLKKRGNELMAFLGGREVHPINVRVGGFYKTPSRRELSKLKPDLERGRDDAIKSLRWIAALPFPEFERDYECVSLKHPDEYPFNEGRIVSSGGLDIPVEEFEAYFEEEHVSHSNALHGVMKRRATGAGVPGDQREEGEAYLVGPLARFNLNFELLTPLAREAAKEAGLDGQCANPFKSIIVRAVEVLYAFEEAIRIIDQYEPPERPFVEVTPRAGEGCGATEAPRGLLFHRYRIAGSGDILEAKIVPPTSQNQRMIEEDLAAVVPLNLNLDHDALTWRCEQTVRNYDPCISCATHFLRLELVREPA